MNTLETISIEVELNPYPGFIEYTDNLDELDYNDSETGFLRKLRNFASRLFRKNKIPSYTV